MAAVRTSLRPNLRRAVTLTNTSIRTTIRSTPTNSNATRSFHNASRCAAYYRQPFNYQRFQTSKTLLYRWSQSPTFAYQVGGLGLATGGFYYVNLEEVPVSGRRRFNIISPASERSQGEEMYKQVMQEYEGQILPSWHPKVMLVQRVLDRLIPHSGLPSEENQWEVHVIEDEQKNAFVIPGGKVFVFSGILEITKTEDGLAAVLGHEIAHNVAHHSAEAMSQAGVLLPLGWLVSLFLGLNDFSLTNILIDYGFKKPNGRKQESEADYIGLMMMSEACFDAKQAVGLWKRMEEEEKAMGGSVPQFLSTHPSNHARQEAIQSWLEQAERKAESAGCTNMSSYVADFKHTFRSHA